MVKIQNLRKYEGSDSGNHARSEQYSSQERSAVPQVLSYLEGINQSSLVAYLDCASYQQSSNIARAWRHIDYSLCLSYMSAAGKGGSIKASWANKRRFETGLRWNISPQTNKQTNKRPWKSPIHLLCNAGSALLFYFKVPRILSVLVLSVPRLPRLGATSLLSHIQALCWGTAPPPSPCRDQVSQSLPYIPQKKDSSLGGSVIT